MRMREAERILEDKPITERIINDAIESILSIISPRETSLRGTPEYKRNMVRVMLKDGLKELLGGGTLNV